MKMNADDLKIVKDFKQDFFKLSMQAFDKSMNNRPENKTNKAPDPPAPNPKKKYLNWLKNNKQFLSIDKIEKDLEMPFTTIQQWIAGNRDLPNKWVEPLTEWIKEFRKL